MLSASSLAPSRVGEGKIGEGRWDLQTPLVSPAVSVLASHCPEVVGCGSSVLTPGGLAETPFQRRGLRQEAAGKLVARGGRWEGAQCPSRCRLGDH